MSRGFWYFFLKNWRFTYVLVFAIFALGLLSALQIPKESNPDVTIPVVLVSAPFPGASAEDVEEFVINPIEDQILGLSDIDQIDATARRDFGTILIQFQIGIDIDKAVNDVKAQVDLARSDLPTDAEDPIVRKVSFSDEPILRLAISGPFTARELTEYAQELKDRIERVNGVSGVDVLGAQDRELRVIVQKELLDRYQVPLSAVTNAIRSADTDIPIGSIETAGENFTLRFEGKIDSVAQIGTIPILAVGDVPILVQDVAEIQNGFTDQTSVSFLGGSGQETEPAVSLNITKVDGANIIDTVDAIKLILVDPERSFPESLDITTMFDASDLIRTDLHDLFINGLQTIAIVMILLFVFLGWREALLAGLGIPVAFLMTFIVLLPLGYTLNFLTLFSLILALGIIVDGSIVMTEGIHENMKEGYSRKESAQRSVKEFALPLISGTFTTIFAFLPMMFMSGVIGEFVKAIPVTVSLVLTASLFAALAVIPAIGFKWLREAPAKQSLDQPTYRDRITTTLTNLYRDVLQTFLHSRGLRWLLAAILPLFFLASVALPATGVLNVNMFPPGNQEQVFIDIEAPFGTPLAKMTQKIQPIIETLKNDTRVETFQVTVGGTNEHVASVFLLLSKDREEKSLQVIDEYEQAFSEITDLNISVYQQDEGPEASAPVEIRVTGPDLATLETLARQYEDALKQTPGARDVQTSIDETNGEFALSIDRVKARIFGVSTAEVALALRNAVYGVTAATITEHDDDIDVIVKYSLSSEGDALDQIDISSLEGITLSTPRGEVPLLNLVQITYGSSRASIEHRDGDRILKVSSRTDQGVAPQAVFEEVQPRVSEIPLPQGYTVTVGGENEEVDDSFRDLFRAMFLGVFLIAALLVWQFHSFRQPLFILVTIPLALIGVLPGLAFVGQSLSFPGMIGIVALAGIVVNNAIILVDRINYHRLQGEAKRDAVVHASLSRLQPILLTTVTTVAGILPITLSKDIWGPLGFSIIFGLLFSTILTLIVVPLLYIRFGERHVNGEEDEIVSSSVPKISLLGN